MDSYIGTKIIKAELAKPCNCKEAEGQACSKCGKEGYTVVYSNPDGTTYESWSPKDVFEASYTKVDVDKLNTRAKVTDIVSGVNSITRAFLPQSYLFALLDKLEEHNFTFIKGGN